MKKAETGVTCYKPRSTKGYRQPLEVSSFGVFRGSMALWTPEFQASGLQNYENTFLFS